jgi:hypothetical protein
MRLLFLCRIQEYFASADAAADEYGTVQLFAPQGVTPLHAFQILLCALHTKEDQIIMRKVRSERENARVGSVLAH